MDGDGMITKDELKKLVEKVCQTYFCYIWSSYKCLSFLYLGWRENDWGWGQGPDSPGRQGKTSEARPRPSSWPLTKHRTATRASTSLSSASSGPPSRARARWVRRNISPVFVIYLLGTRRTRFHRSLPLLLFSIKAAEEILTTCLRGLVFVSLETKHLWLSCCYRTLV